MSDGLCKKCGNYGKVLKKAASGRGLIQVDCDCGASTSVNQPSSPQHPPAVYQALLEAQEARRRALELQAKMQQVER